MNENSVGTIFKKMSIDDKAALQALKKEVEEKLGKPVTIADMIRAVTPGAATPEALKAA